MFIDFIKIINQVKEFEFLDKLFLALSFQALEPEDQEVLLEQIKTDPKLLNKIVRDYSKRKEFLKKGDDVGYCKYQTEEEKKLKEMVEKYLEEEKQKQIKKIITSI
jgi:TRAP-type C4-dicarboxylate transport system substrate-binding protein